MNLHRRKFLRQAIRGGGRGFVSTLVAPALLLTHSFIQSAWAGNQAEEALSDSIRTALSQAVLQSGPPVPVLNTELEKKQFNEWTNKASLRLSQWMKHPDDRSEFLHTVWYEARRAGLSLSLVMGLIEVESAFRKYAISSAGARGYMQVMPFGRAALAMATKVFCFIRKRSFVLVVSSCATCWSEKVATCFTRSAVTTAAAGNLLIPNLSWQLKKNGFSQ